MEVAVICVSNVILAVAACCWVFKQYLLEPVMPVINTFCISKFVGLLRMFSVVCSSTRFTDFFSLVLQSTSLPISQHIHARDRSILCTFMLFGIKSKEGARG